MIRSKHQELHLAPGDIFYIPKGLKYVSQWFRGEDPEIEFYSFGFSIAPTKNTYILQKIPRSGEIDAQFSQLCRQFPFTDKAIGILYRFFSVAAEHMLQADKSYSNPLIEKATAYIRSNPNASIAQVAASCNTSESNLYNAFKRHVGRTPNEVRLQALCREAVTLLSTTNRAVQDISNALGFSSSSYFRKILRKHTGKTPLQIRKEAAF